MAAVQIRVYRNTAGLSPNVPRGLDPVCQDGSHKSSVVKLEHCVPHGSVLGPMLFTIYCSLVEDVTTDHGIHYH